MNSAKQNAHNQQVLNELLRHDDNKFPTFVNISASSFVCDVCAGLLREINHRIKSVSASTFTLTEMDDIQGGNRAARKIWLGKWSDSIHLAPNGQHREAMRLYITEKYVDKLYFVEPTKRSQHSSSLYMLDQKLSVKMLSSLEIRSQSEPLPRISLSSPTVEIDSSLFSSLSIARKSCTHPPPQLLPDLLSDGDAAQVPDDDFGDFQSSGLLKTPSTTYPSSAHLRSLEPILAHPLSPLPLPSFQAEPTFFADFSSATTSYSHSATSPSSYSGNIDRYQALREFSNTLAGNSLNDYSSSSPKTAAFALGRGWASLTPIADQSLSSGLEDFNLSSITLVSEPQQQSPKLMTDNAQAHSPLSTPSTPNEPAISSGDIFGDLLGHAMLGMPCSKKRSSAPIHSSPVCLF
ncbi:hypothetical protein BSLG_002156 [Batrachochytrium salamandrivorans]|nr:hypothetical protein BSLG_002156 [Batrachochytrium salamandrivorans]